MNSRLLPPRDFADRHCGPSAADQQQMLEALGLNSLEDLTQALPPDILTPAADTDRPHSEGEALSALYGYARNNVRMASMIGLGYYGVEMSAVIRRKMLEDPAWYTAYTPYQPEIAQGRLEMLLNFQTMIADLTGLPMAGASLLDEATAAAEAMGLMWRESGGKKTRFLADERLFPQTLAVLQTRADPLGIEVHCAAAETFTEHPDAFGALLAYPGGDGAIRDFTDLIAALKANGTRVAMAVDLLSLTLLKSPGDMGADYAVGSAQRLGLPMGAGGPHAGFIAFHPASRMRVPGRIVGISHDSKGRPAYRLALQSREQHIRREKATSNICTAQALPAMLAAAHVIYHGPRRLQAAANRVQTLAEILARGLQQLGFAPAAEHYFGGFDIACEHGDGIIARAAAQGVNLRRTAGGIGFSIDEMTRPAHIEKVWQAFAEDAPAFNDMAAAQPAPAAIPPSLQRQTPYLTQAVFNSYHTEQEMLRYLRRLAEKDIALNRSMIALGSCTMKLNATIEMEPISWPQFADVHPFAPTDQTSGYNRLLTDFADTLARLTGFHKVSLQPNAGAQGEYAGLLTIRAYLRDRGEQQRDICLIPGSAHGTNPASAVMAGMRVITLAVDHVGQVDIDDLRDKVAAHKDTLAALMLTYPSTCGVAGDGLRTICDIVHEGGGQVYMDGANLNALVGISLPGKLGPDVMHINLHKTFCIPHGGGGPGMGPIAVGSHLAPYLPGHPLAPSPEKHCGTIAAAPFGSPLILIIPWMYIYMMGSAGLRRATLTALLNANYIVRRLEKHYPLYYRSSAGFVAHECIVDTRGIKKETGISVEDIAKRLMDFGYHAPTVSWPVAGALMIEPTESESKRELDRFCEAMQAIAAEIDCVKSGDWPLEDNPLVHAPHTADDVVSDEWAHAYGREAAAYPAAWVRQEKYWPPVSRIDAAYGDRNLVCCWPAADNDQGSQGSQGDR